jgi:hypothetical protein
MKTKQGIFIGLVLIIIIIIFALFYVISSLDSLVAAAIEKYGSDVTQTKVTVSSVKITLKSGEGAVSGLKIGNPQEFSSGSAFSLDNITLKIDTNTITKDPIVIDEILITSPHAVYEINESGASNIDLLKNNIRRYQQKSEASRKSSTDTRNGDRRVNLVIRKLIVENGQVAVNIFALDDKKMSAKLPRIQLSNIGREKGVSPGEVAEQVFAALVKNVGPAIAGLNIEQYLGKNVDEIGKKAQQEVERKIDESIDRVTKEDGDSVKKLLGK